MVMGNLAAGVTLIVLALLVGVTFVLDQSASDVTPEPLNDLLPDQNYLDDPGDDTVVLTMGRGRDLVRRKKPPTEERPDIFDPEEHDGVLTPSEKRRLTSKGYLPYVIQDGDSLSKIAKTYLGDSRMWHLIREHNARRIIDANDIQPGMTVNIPVWLRR